MSKKIEVSTIKQTADVEVMFINSNLISKALRATIAAESIIDKMQNDSYRPTIRKVEENVLDENNNVVTDENGNPKTKPMLDENGNQVYDYDDFRMPAYIVERFHTVIVPFLEELTDAFEAE